MRLVGDRSVEPPDEDSVQFAAAGGGEKFLPHWPLQSAGADFFDLCDDLPATSSRVLPYGPLQRMSESVVL